MPYTKQQWKYENEPGAIPIDPDHLNHIESGLFGISAAGTYPATATISGNVVSIQCDDPAPPAIRFPAPADHSDAHTYTLNGSPLTITDLNGEPLSDAWKEGALVDLAISYVGGSARGFFKGGGGGKIEVEIETPGMWQSAAASRYARSNPATATDGEGSVWVIGGSTGATWQAYIDKFLLDGTLVPVSAGLSVARNTAATNTGNGDVWALGGSTAATTASAVVDSFTPSGTRTVRSALSTARFSLAAATSGNGDAWALGGTTNSSTASAVVESYTASGTRTTRAALSVARWELAATTAGNGDVWVFGGRASSGYSDVVESYTPGGTRTIRTSLSVARSGLAACTDANGNVMAIGGVNSSGADSDVVESYTPGGTRTIMPPLSLARRTLAATRIGDCVLVAGGRSSVTGSAQYVKTVDWYSADGDHGTLDDLSVGRSQLAAATDGNGKALVVCGYDGSASSKVVDTYAPQVEIDMPLGTKYKFKEHATEQVSSTGSITVESPNTGYLKPAKQWTI